MNYRVVYRFAATAAALLLLRPLHAATPQYADLDSIRAAAEQAVRDAAGVPAADLEVSADALDARLRLPQCPEALHTLITGDGQLRDHTTVGVRCESGMRWALYLGVSVATRMPVLVAQRALPRDAIPAPGDFKSVVRRLPGLAGSYVRDASMLAGQHLRRSVALGEALGVDALQLSAVVHRGQQLTLLAHANGMDVRVTVVALADGRPEERIRVQNPNSQRVVEATVRSAQLVEVSL
jgi:flagella basal body P-ring formation protein FlgA